MVVVVMMAVAEADTQSSDGQEHFSLTRKTEPKNIEIMLSALFLYIWMVPDL
jgi:hypothetical protein